MDDSCYFYLTAYSGCRVSENVSFMVLGFMVLHDAGCHEQKANMVHHGCFVMVGQEFKGDSTDLVYIGKGLDLGRYVPLLFGQRRRAFLNIPSETCFFYTVL